MNEKPKKQIHPIIKGILDFRAEREGTYVSTTHYILSEDYPSVAPHLLEHFSEMKVEKVKSGRREGQISITISE
jgi:hypothetical protein